MSKNFIAAVKMTALSVAVTASLTACQATQTNRADRVESFAPQGVMQISAADQLNAMLDQYFAETMMRSPLYATFVGINDYNDKFGDPITQASLNDGLAFEYKYLAAVNAIDESQLGGQDLLSYQIFKRDREMAIKGSRFPTHLMPLSQMGGAHTFFAILGSGSSAQPFNTEADYRDFMKRAEGFSAYMDSAITAMKEGVEKGVVLPTPIAEKVVPQLSAHVVDDITASVFYGPVTALADKDGVPEEIKAVLAKEYSDVIQNVIVPAYKRVHDYMVEDYLPATRKTVGLSELPDGKAWYEYRIATNTTLPLSAEEIHEFGQQEVARILSEMKKVKETVGFEGDLPAFFTYLREDDQFYFETGQEVVDAYNDIKDKINGRVGMLFEVFPKSDYEVRAVEAFRAASAAGASYQSPSPDGSRPGIFYINTHNLKAQPKFLMETLSIHEAAPGHHFQIAIQQEVEGLPEFRKFGGYTVFAEGWALYAESLGKEMGLFTDPYMWYGRLADEQLRAMRLVVDTGLHAFGWTREQAIAFMRDNSSMAESDIVAEVERYISIGGQALSYKVGERHIRMLRNKAKAALGDKFDVKKFHTQILTDGAMPMPILEAKIDRWIAEQQA